LLISAEAPSHLFGYHQSTSPLVTPRLLRREMSGAPRTLCLERIGSGRKAVDRVLARPCSLYRVSHGRKPNPSAETQGSAVAPKLRSSRLSRHRTLAQGVRTAFDPLESDSEGHSYPHVPLRARCSAVLSPKTPAPRMMIDWDGLDMVVHYSTLCASILGPRGDAESSRPK
jgi:hypothetical protein